MMKLNPFRPSTTRDIRQLFRAEVNASAPVRRAVGPPILPLVGSLPWLGGLLKTPDGRPSGFVEHPYEALAALRQKYGGVYRLGLPGLGVSASGETHVVSDPRLFHAVLKAEGQFPLGAIQMHWPSIGFYQSTGSPLAQFHGQGEDWKRMRLAMQKGILLPHATNSFAPAIADAAAAASRGARAGASAMAAFTSRASFDMFAALALGRRTRTADASARAEPADERFCADTVEALERLGPTIHHLPSLLLHRTLCLRSRAYAAYLAAAAGALGHAAALSTELLGRAKACPAQLSELERASYLVATHERALANRRLADGGDCAAAAAAISDEELVALISLTLMAAVDTTSSIVNWCLVHLARSPGAQAALRAELRAALARAPLHAVAGEGSEAALPYMRAVVREAHRLTPALPISSVKAVQEPLELGGVRLEQGAVVCLDSFSLANDPALVEQPDAFRPERWLPGAVAARKGTPSELIDHRLLAAPFSAGARKCPGSRVASIEVRALLGALVSDWHLELETPIASVRDIPYLSGTTVGPHPMPPLRLTSVAAAAGAQ